MDIRHDDRLALLRRHTADAFAHRDANTRGITLKWTKHELVVAQKIKPGPVHIRQRIEKQRTKVGGIRDEVVLAFEQAQQLDHEARVQFAFVRIRTAILERRARNLMQAGSA